MDTAPAGAVDEGVLRRLLAPNGEVPRKRVAIFYRPHTAADAVKIVDSDFKDALAAEQSGKGLTSAAATIKVESTARARRGAGPRSRAGPVRAAGHHHRTVGRGSAGGGGDHP